MTAESDCNLSDAVSERPSTPGLTTGSSATDTEWSSESEYSRDSAWSCSCGSGCDCRPAALSLGSSPFLQLEPTATVTVTATATAAPDAWADRRFVDTPADSVVQSHPELELYAMGPLTAFRPALRLPAAVPDWYLNLASLRLFHAETARQERVAEGLGRMYEAEFSAVRKLAQQLVQAGYTIRHQPEREQAADLRRHTHQQNRVEEMRRTLAGHLRRVEEIDRALKHYTLCKECPRVMVYDEGTLGFVDVADEDAEIRPAQLPEMTKEVGRTLRRVWREGRRLYAQRMWADLDLDVD